MNKIISILFIAIFISGCNLSNPNLLNKDLTQLKTYNGSLILISKDTINFCDKESVDNLLNRINPYGIIDEFSINNFDTLVYENNKEKYSKIISDNSSCLYTNYILDFTSKENYIILDEISVKANDKITLETFKERGVFETFISKQPQSINAVLLNELLKQVAYDSIVDTNFKVEEDGDYKLIAQPLFRIYYLEDTKKIYDYDFSTMIGFKLKLVKK